MIKPTVPHAPDQEVADLALLEFQDARAVPVLEELRKRLSNTFGVTVIGPHLTLRWYSGKHFVQASFVCTQLEHSGLLTRHDPDFDK